MYTLAIILLFVVAMFFVVALQRQAMRRVVKNLDGLLTELRKTKPSKKDDNNPETEWAARMESYFVTSFLTSCCTGILTEAMEQDDREEFLRAWRQRMRAEINSFTNLYQNAKDDPEQKEIAPVIGDIIDHYDDGEELRMCLDTSLTHIYDHLRRNLKME